MLGEALNQLVQGFTLIGDAAATVLISIAASFGLKLPDWGARLSMLTVSALLVWRFQRMMPKLILAAVAVLSVSIILGFI